MKNSTKNALLVFDPKIMDAALEFLGRRDLTRHPKGRSDGGGRWYPIESEDPHKTIRNTIRSPSRAWPWTYAHACRSAAHVAELYGVDATEVRKAAKNVEKPTFLPTIIY